VAGVRIEDYGLIGDTRTAAMVGRDGSIDWWCVPRFDAAACFAKLLGDDRHGCWRIGPSDGSVATSRRYRAGTLVLESTFTTADGSVRLVDFMPMNTRHPTLVRIVEGIEGTVQMTMDLVIRFDYGRSTPWVRRLDGRLLAVAGPDALVLDAEVVTHGGGGGRDSSGADGDAMRTVSSFRVAAGDVIPLTLAWSPSHVAPEPAPDPTIVLDATVRWWQEWAGRGTYRGEWHEPVERSLITLKALTYAPTGGIVAAVTTSLPEQIGGVRNWDYRYCWLRDATFTLYAFMTAGYEAEAHAWRDWLLRAVAGSPSEMQIMYGCAGERRLSEYEVPWLSGYEGSAPVRVGNAAVDQFQLDVYGEVMDSMHQARRIGIPATEYQWGLEQSLMEFLESHWRDPDDGIWETRGGRAHFTHSKTMAWVAADRAVKAVERFGLSGPVERWRRLREEIRSEVLDRGWSERRQSFTQSYDGDALDAVLLMMPLVGFLPATDPRVRATVAAIERELCEDGFVHRYSQPDATVDGLPPGEGAFLACTFWLADNYALAGRHDEATATFERLLSLRNDVGLLSEEYDVAARRQVGNVPQAFSHVPLVNTAHNLAIGGGPGHRRSEEHEPMA
jgi:GH15 family glucan-1,4-alpha-glucosidase